MKKFLLVILLVIVSSTSATIEPAQAQSPQTLLERKVFYQFDPTYTDPKSVDKRLSEVRFKGQVLWVSKPNSGKPSILFLPGSGGSLETRTRKFHWFLNQGYGLVALAYPGMAGSKGKPSRERIQYFANAVYQRMPYIIGRSPTIIMGESLGTGVALGIMQHQVSKDRPPLGLILQAPYTSLIDLTAHKRPELLPFFRSRKDLWPSKRMIKKVHAPIFIMHGGNDKTVPVSMGKSLFQLSPSKNKVLVTFPNAGHSSIWRKETLTKLREWIKNL